MLYKCHLLGKGSGFSLPSRRQWPCFTAHCPSDGLWNLDTHMGGQLLGGENTNCGQTSSECCKALRLELRPQDEFSQDRLSSPLSRGPRTHSNSRVLPGKHWEKLGELDERWITTTLTATDPICPRRYYIMEVSEVSPWYTNNKSITINIRASTLLKESQHDEILI